MGETVLRLEELRKSYGETAALDGVSFVLVVLAADSGQVLWRGAPIDAEARRRIGYMPEERGLYPKMRVRDQLLYMARLHGASEADAGAAADRWMERLGIAARADDAVEALSLGNQQRVQLGVALVHEPDLLVLDEPFSGLDPDGVDALGGALVTEIPERQVPVVFSSHQLELVERLCDSVAIIAGGRIAASGPLAEAGRWARSSARRRAARARTRAARRRAARTAGGADGGDAAEERRA